jgi:arylsulfatase A-like enzyme
MTTRPGCPFALPLLFAFAVTSWPGSARAAAPARPPNIVVILSDDQGRGDYSAFGTRDVRTPAIDRIAREGVTFSNFYANSCVCSPTRAALLSGCYPDRVGVPGVIREETPLDSWGYLSPRATLLPAVLKSAGYHCAIVGKWHLGISSPNTPTERGFDHFHGFLGDMMDDYVTHRRNGQNFMRLNRETIDPPGHATDLFTQWACDYIADRAATAPGKPFFLYLAYNAPHDPLQPKAEWLERVHAREPNLPEKRAKLLGLIEHMDDGIGRVLEAIDKAGVANDTLLMFTSDNGGLLPSGANNGPWRSGKTHMYEGGLRVPFVARWPGHVKPGTTSGHLGVSMDVFATACEAAGVKPPAGVDAVSFLSALRGEAVPGAADRELYFVRREGGLAYDGKTIEAVIKGDWKIVQDSPFARAELYNLNADPKEEHDVAATEKETFRRMSAALRRHVQRGGATPWQAAEAP